MSYCRMPSMIYKTETGVQFELSEISDTDINIFLYKLFLKSRREELRDRVKRGREFILGWQDMMIELDGMTNEDSEAARYKKWLLENEDEMLSTLINGEK